MKLRLWQHQWNQHKDELEWFLGREVVPIEPSGGLEPLPENIAAEARMIARRLCSMRSAIFLLYVTGRPWPDVTRYCEDPRPDPQPPLDDEPY